MRFYHDRRATGKTSAAQPASPAPAYDRIFAAKAQRRENAKNKRHE
jgi:hypothetical protein